jgi:hypothetical protein
LKNNGFKEETGTKILLDAIGTSTTLESNKSHSNKQHSVGAGFVQIPGAGLDGRRSGWIGNSVRPGKAGQRELEDTMPS